MVDTLQLQSTEYDNENYRRQQKRLGATFWQEQINDYFKPIAFASRFLTETERKRFQRFRNAYGSMGSRTVLYI